MKSPDSQSSSQKTMQAIIKKAKIKNKKNQTTISSYCVRNKKIYY